MKENNDKLPIQMKGVLFELAQMLRIFSDSKTFPDCVPRVGSDDIKAKASAYIEQCASDLAELWGSNKDDHQEQVVRTAKRMHKLAHQLKQLVNDEFILPAKAQGSIPPSPSMEKHIERLWYYLTRQPSDFGPNGTLIPLEYPCITPGGRYAEFYYWDSYFVAVGLLASGRIKLLQNLIDNAADLIKKCGHMPNGNRLYYLSRSQAPYFLHMLRLLAKARGEGEVAQEEYWKALKEEYQFWM